VLGSVPSYASPCLLALAEPAPLAVTGPRTWGSSSPRPCRAPLACGLLSALHRRDP